MQIAGHVCECDAALRKTLILYKMELSSVWASRLRPSGLILEELIRLDTSKDSKELSQPERSFDAELQCRRSSAGLMV